jgi:tetratricopeptide (TPR) repeat protein
MVESLVAAVEKEDLGQYDLTDAALIASGFETSTSLREARAEFERLVGPLIESLKIIPDEKERGRVLLERLHAKGGPLGGKYDARATTLKDVLDRRAFNCVSSAVVYNVVAERAGLKSSAQLLPTHARSLLGKVVVETTSPHGFDPDSSRQREILRAVAGPSADENARSLVSEGGAIVTTVVLIGTIYVNRASIAQESGDLERAERLFARGEAFAITPEMRQILRDQRAALLSQLGADDITSGDPERYARAYRSLRSAVKLDPREPRIRGAVFQNLRAAAERMITTQAGRGEEGSLLELAGEAASFGLAPAERSGLRAFALSEVARLRIDANKFDEAVDAIEQALREQLGPPDQKLKVTLEQNRIAALRLAAITSAKQGDFGKSTAYLDRLEATGGLSAEQRTTAEQDRLRVVHIVGSKLIDERKFEAAATIYREGVRRYPTDANARHNLIAVLERLAIPFAEDARCAEAEPYLAELQSVDPSSSFPERARSRCLTERASRRLEANDFAEAVSLMRAALEHRPADASIKKNLAVALMRWASDLSRAGDCKTAKKLVGEVRSLEVPELSGGSLDSMIGGCG